MERAPFRFDQRPRRRERFRNVVMGQMRIEALPDHGRWVIALGCGSVELHFTPATAHAMAEALNALVYEIATVDPEDFPKRH